MLVGAQGKRSLNPIGGGQLEPAPCVRFEGLNAVFAWAVDGNLKRIVAPDATGVDDTLREDFIPFHLYCSSL
ncbi:MAG: hypothetical protein SPK06_06645 [Kiritimatiellia bacterium]|nr:hypothetical protein [Kiritimatiellia bacterium]